MTTESTSITEATDISTLSPAQVYDLNQQVLDSILDVQRPLIGPQSGISDLRAEYENGSPSFVKQIDWLKEHGFIAIRRTRGDGDCFYRSVAFSFVERLLKAKDRDLAVRYAMDTLIGTFQNLESVGFEKLVFEDFYDVLKDLVMNIVKPDDAVGKFLDEESLLTALQDNTTSNSIVMYLRMLTSAQLRLDPDSYSPFLFHPETAEQMEVREFCEHFVEATGKEADHVQMTALSRALQINVDIAYLDGRGADGQVEFVKFQDATDTKMSPITLLYRPGHYDILIRDDGSGL